MKRVVFLTTVLAFLLFPISALSYTAYVGVDNSLDLSQLNAFGFDVVGADVINDLTLTIYPQGAVVPVDGVNNPGAVPELVATVLAWDVFKVTNPTDGISGLDAFLGGTTRPLIQGIILSLEGATPFTLNNFVLGSFQGDGSFPGPFTVAENQFVDGAQYTYTNPVPIPGSILLLGSGLVGLIGIVRRRRS